MLGAWLTVDPGDRSKVCRLLVFDTTDCLFGNWIPPSVFRMVLKGHAPQTGGCNTQACLQTEQWQIDTAAGSPRTSVITALVASLTERRRQRSPDPCRKQLVRSWKCLVIDRPCDRTSESCDRQSWPVGRREYLQLCSMHDIMHEMHSRRHHAFHCFSSAPSSAFSSALLKCC